MDDDQRAERFAAIPYRATEALQRRDISFDGWGVLAYLIASANHKTEQWVGMRARLQDELGWEKSDDTLRRVLRALRDDGWIELDVAERQRKPLVITLTAARLRHVCRTEPPSYAADTAAPPQSEGTVVPLSHAASDAAATAALSQTQEVDVDGDSGPSTVSSSKRRSNAPNSGEGALREAGSIEKGSVEIPHDIAAEYDRISAKYPDHVPSLESVRVLVANGHPTEKVLEFIRDRLPPTAAEEVAA